MDSSSHSHHDYQQRQTALYASQRPESTPRPQDDGMPGQSPLRPAYPLGTGEHHPAYSPSMRPFYSNGRQSMYGGNPSGQASRMVPVRPGHPPAQGEPYSNRVSMGEAPPSLAMTGVPHGGAGGYVYRSNTISPASRQPAAIQSHPSFSRRGEALYSGQQQQQTQYRQYEAQQGYYRESAPVRQVSMSQHPSRPPPPPPPAGANNLSYHQAPYPTFPDGRPLVPAPLARPPPSGVTSPLANRPPPGQMGPQRSMTISQVNGNSTPSNRYSTIGTVRTMLPTAPTPPTQSVAQMESTHLELSSSEHETLGSVPQSAPLTTTQGSPDIVAPPAPRTEPISARTTAATMANGRSPAIAPENMARSRSSGPMSAGTNVHHHPYPGYPPTMQNQGAGYALYDAPVSRQFNRPVSTISDSSSLVYPNGATSGVHKVAANSYTSVSRMHSTAGLSRVGNSALTTHWEAASSRPTMPLTTSAHHRPHHLGAGGGQGLPPSQRSASAMVPVSAKQQPQRQNVPAVPRIPQSYSRQITLSKIPANEEVPSMPGRTTSKNGKVRIQLQFDRPFFNAGGELSGRLELQCSSSRSVMLADMVIELVGYEALSKDHLAPRIFHKTILRLQDAHHPSQAVQEHIDPDGEGFWVARKGRTIFPFRLNIQDTLPNSYESKLGQVRYVTSAIAYMKASHKEVIHHSREVYIYETWTTDDITQARRKSVKADTSKRLFLGGEGSLEMYAELTRTMVSSGGIVYVNVGVKNLTKKKIMGIKLSLWRHVAAFYARGSTGSGASPMSSKDQDSVKNYSEIIYKGEDYNFDGDDPRIVVLPVYIPSGVYSLRNTRYLHVQFFVQISLMASLSKALAVELPIYITHASSWSDPPPRVPKDFSFPVHEDEPSVKNKTGVFAKKKPSPINTSTGGATSSSKSCGKRASISGPATGALSASSTSSTSRLASTSTLSLPTSSSTLPYGRRAPLKDPDSPTSVLDLAQASNLFVVNPDSGRAEDEGTTPALLSSAPSKPKEVAPKQQKDLEMDESHYRPSEIIYDSPTKEIERPVVVSSTSGTSMSSAEVEFVVPAQPGAAPSSGQAEKSLKKPPSSKMGLRKTLAKLSITIPNAGGSNGNNSSNNSSSSSLNLNHGTGSSSRISPRVLPNTSTTNGISRSPSSSNKHHPSLRPYASSEDLSTHSGARRTSVSSHLSSASRGYGQSPLEQNGSETLESPSERATGVSQSSSNSNDLPEQQQQVLSSSPQSYVAKPLSRESSLSTALSRQSSSSSMNSYSSASRMDRFSSRRSSVGSVRIMAISPGRSSPSEPSEPMTPVVIEGVGVVETAPLRSSRRQDHEHHHHHSEPAEFAMDAEDDLTPTTTPYGRGSMSAPGSAIGTRDNSPTPSPQPSAREHRAFMDDYSYEPQYPDHHHHHYHPIPRSLTMTPTEPHAEDDAVAHPEHVREISETTPYDEMASAPIYDLEDDHSTLETEAMAANGGHVDPSHHHPTFEEAQIYSLEASVSRKSAVVDGVMYSDHPHFSSARFQHHDGHQHHYHQHSQVPPPEINQAVEDYPQEMTRSATPTQMQPHHNQTEDAVPITVFEQTTSPSPHASGHTTPKSHRSHSQSPVQSQPSSPSTKLSRQSSMHMTRALRDMMITPAAYPTVVETNHGRQSPIKKAAAAVIRHHGSSSSLRSNGSTSTSSPRSQSPFPAMRVNQLRQEHDVVVGNGDGEREGGASVYGCPDSPDQLDTFLRASVSSESLPYLSGSPVMKQSTAMGAPESPLSTAQVLTNVYGDYYDDAPQVVEEGEPLEIYEGYHGQEVLAPQDHESLRPRTNSGDARSHLVSVLPLASRRSRPSPSMAHISVTAAPPEVDHSLSGLIGGLRVANNTAASPGDSEEHHHHHHHQPQQQQQQYDGHMRAPSPRYASSFYSGLSDDGDLTTANTTPIFVGPDDEGQSTFGYPHESGYEQTYLDRQRQQQEQERSYEAATYQMTATATTGDMNGLSHGTVIAGPSSEPALTDAAQLEAAEKGIQATAAAGDAGAGHQDGFSLQDRRSYPSQPQYAPVGPKKGVENQAEPYETLGLSSDGHVDDEHVHTESFHQAHAPKPGHQASRPSLVVVPPRTQMSSYEGPSPLVTVAAAMASTVSGTPSSSVPISQEGKSGVARSEDPSLFHEYQSQPGLAQKPAYPPQAPMHPANQHYQQQDGEVGVQAFTSAPPKIPPRPPGYLSPTAGSQPKFLASGNSSRTNSHERLELASLPPLPLSPAHPPPSPGQPQPQPRLLVNDGSGPSRENNSSDRQVDLASLPPLPLSPGYPPSLRSSISFSSSPSPSTSPSPGYPLAHLQQQQQQQPRFLASGSGSGDNRGNSNPPSRMNSNDWLDLPSRPSSPLSPAHPQPGQQQQQQQQQQFHQPPTSPAMLPPLPSSPFPPTSPTPLGYPSVQTGARRPPSPPGAADTERHDVVIQVGSQDEH